MPYFMFKYCVSNKKISKSFNIFIRISMTKFANTTFIRTEFVKLDIGIHADE